MAKKKTKSCTRCHKKKPLDDFVPSYRAADGYSQYCRICWGKIMKKAKKDKKAKEAKAVVAQAKATAPRTVESSARAAVIGRRVETANAALQRANGVPGSQRSPLRKAMKEIHKMLADQGAEIEQITFGDGTCTVTYRKTETFNL